ncbi:MAG: Lrp/AsnC family transcriptional regulator [bacterium]
MLNAIVLLEVERSRVNEIADELASLEGVAEVYSVAGRYDLVAMLRVENNEDLSDLVTGSLLQVDGIKKSETLIAFRVHSSHDLEAMFSIGLE